ncbi:NUDIX domain-containing protein [Chromohalobacter japonicus]|uniref:NUDIX domain-containing protein n=1 Tax=Chromohalobacter japonicus TaxID=223900 RepID=UPI000590778A|nr:NUDIX domain-containing protein [Chromohalobacter japonicus]
MAEQAHPYTPRYAHESVEERFDETLQSGFFSLERRHYRHRRFDGGWSERVLREVHVRHDAVGVLLYDPQRDCVVHVEQIRAGALDDPLSPWKLEPVAGLVDAGETSAEVARRESMEEAGCTIDELIELYTYYPSPGACTERVTLFCGLVDSDGVGGVHGLESENEDIQVHVLSFAKTWALLEQGVIDNAMSLIALNWLVRERASLRARR